MTDGIIQKAFKEIRDAEYAIEVDVIEQELIEKIKQLDDWHIGIEIKRRLIGNNQDEKLNQEFSGDIE